MSRTLTISLITLAMLCVAFAPGTALGITPAPEGPGVEAPDSQEQSAGDQQSEQASDEDDDQEPQPRYEETVVVTASSREQLLLEAPTAMSVVGELEIATSGAQNYADLLRSVPGLNVSQTSARDINLTSRAATSTLATTQLVLVDGRTVYQDFFGFVLWDLLPVELSEIDQIEVVNGPTSAVYGANAMTGVVNLITKSPRQLGDTTQLTIGGGEQSTGKVSILQGGVHDPWSYKLSASYLTQDPWPRPERLPSGQPAQIFPNQGTDQPAVDFRIDRILSEESYMSLRGGIAGTSGIIHTGIGPFDIDDGSNFWHVRTDYNRNAANVRFFANVLNGDGLNLLNGILFDFKTQTYDFSASNTNYLADGQHILTYGGNVRFQNFDLSIAPGEDSRQEGGAFIEDSISLGDHVTVNAGARIDGFSVIDDAVFSPRVSVQFFPVPAEDHVIRGSFGRAFRAPSLVNNFLDVTIFNQIFIPFPSPPFPPGSGVPFTFPTAAIGNEDLVEEQLDQWEIGYRGVWGDRVSVDFAYYRSTTQDSINFTPFSFYSPLDPPPRWPLPPIFVPVNTLPKTFTYLNLAQDIDNQGVELGFQVDVHRANRLTVNYTWQDAPDPERIGAELLNIPPENRFNVAFNGAHEGWMYGASVNYVGDAFWADVLDERFFGPTESFTTLNASAGYAFLDRGIEVTISGTNLTDEDFQQHVFGDIIGRRVMAEFTFNIR